MDFPTFAFFVAGLVLLVVGAELLVRGASQLAVAVGIAPLVVGLTVVAYGTSAPELAVTVKSTYEGKPDLAIGNVVGSNISNLLLVLGIAALVAPLGVARSLVRSTVPFMIAISVLLWLLAVFDGRLGRFDGALLAGGAILYSVRAIRRSRAEIKMQKEEVAAEATVVPDGGNTPSWILQFIFIIVGLLLLVLGADWLVDGAVKMAEMWKVSPLVIGLTIVAVGTSLPEIATSIVASIRGQRDIAVGNVVGSNIFNILLVLGVCALVSPNGVHVSPAALRFDLPVMIIVSVASLPVFFTGYVIDRWEGLFFLGYYAAYTTYLFLQANQDKALEPFSWIMFVFVIPLTVLTLLGMTFYSFRKKQRPLPEK